jgi:UDP-glucose 4-epimerase
MNNVLVTGGCGFVGYALVKELLLKNYHVDVIDDLSIGKEAKDVKELGCNFIKDDIRNIDKLPLKNYKYIFHLAALSRIQPSFKQPELTFSVNVEGTKKVVEYALKTRSKLIYSGSSSRHHNPELSPYAMSKHMGEEWIKLYKKVYGLNSEIVRFYNVYGPGELVDSHMAAVIGIWRHRINESLPILIHGNGEQRRDFTHIYDIVDGLIRIAESEETHSEAWELGTGRNYSLNEVADMFENSKREYVPDVKGNYRETLRVNDDAINILGWKPKDRLRTYIKSLL